MEGSALYTRLSCRSQQVGDTSGARVPGPPRAQPVDSFGEGRGLHPREQFRSAAGVGPGVPGDPRDTQVGDPNEANSPRSGLRGPSWT